MEVLQLQKLLQEKDRECQILQNQVAAVQQSTAKLVQADGEELLRLQNEIHRLEEEKLATMKAAVWNSDVSLQSERDLAARDEAFKELRRENTSLRAGLENLQAAHQVAKNHETSEKDAVISALQSQLEKALLAIANQPGPASRQKDEEDFASLRTAIQELEERLILAEQHNSGSQAVEDSGDRDAPPPQDSANTNELYLKLTATQRHLIKARENLHARDETLIGMQSLLEEEVELSKRLKQDLWNERQLRFQAEASRDQPQEIETDGKATNKAVQISAAPAPLAELRDGGNGNVQLESWRQQKRLQKQIDTLKAKLKEKSDEDESQAKQRERLNAHVAALRKELEESSAKASKLEEKLASAAAAPLTFFTAEQCQEMTGRLAVLEERNAKLEAQLPETAGREASVPAGSTAQEQAASMLDLVRERDGAIATLLRLKQRIGDLFGPDAAQLDALAAQSKTGTRGKTMGDAAARKEAQLRTTIAALQRMIDRAQKEAATAVSATKFAQVVQKKKELQSKLEEFESESKAAAGLKDEILRLEKRCQHLQRMNDGFQRDARKLQSKQRQTEQALEALRRSVQPPANPQPPAARETESLAANADADARPAAPGAGPEESAEQTDSGRAAAENPNPKGGGDDSNELRDRLEAALQENEALRAELSAKTCAKAISLAYVFIAFSCGRWRC